MISYRGELYMIWEEAYECMPLDELYSLQTARLKSLVKNVYEHVPFYKELFDAHGVTPGDIRSVDDIARLPFTYKSNLRDNYPFQMFAVPIEDVIEIHASSGTTGKPTVVAYTRNDLKLWSTVMARTIAMAGAQRGDIIQNAYGYGLFTGGLGVHYGALELGIPVVPMSSGNTQKQLQLMHDFNTTIITCTPSYALYMAEEAKDRGIDLRESPIRIGIFGAEPWTEQMRDKIEELWNITALDVYGLSEIIGPGVAQECIGKNGLHIYADHFYPEIIDPATGTPVKKGNEGELVITTLTKEALPLIRYRTGDIVSITHEPCSACGRTLPRISKVLGRTDDMLIIRGINVFPSQIESVLLNIKGAQPHYQLIIDREHALDTIEVQVEVDENFFSDEIKVLEQLQYTIKKEIESVLSLSVKVSLVEPKTIARSMGKAKRVIDNRTL